MLQSTRFAAKHFPRLGTVLVNQPALIQWGHHSTSLDKSPSFHPLRNLHTDSAIKAFDATMQGQSLPGELLVLLDSMFTFDAALQMVKSSPTMSRRLLDGNAARGLVVELARTELPQRSLLLIRLAHALGSHLKQNVYECTAHEYASKGNWAQVLDVVSLGVELSGRTTLRLLNWRTRALVEEQDFSELEGILGEFDKYKLSPSRRTFHLLLTGHIRNHNLHQAKACLRYMSAAGCPPDASTYSILVTVFRPLGADPEVLAQAIQSLPDVQTQGNTMTAVLNSLLQIYFDARRPPEVLRILTMFKEYDTAASLASTYRHHAVVGGLYESVDDPPSIHQLPNLPPVTPDAGTFSILLNDAAKRHDISSASQYLQIMAHTNVKPTSDTAVSLIHVLFATHNEATALQLDTPPTLHIPIPVDHILPTTQILNALLKGLLKSPNGFRVWHAVLRQMQAHGLQPNSTTVELLLTYMDKVEGARPRELLRTLRFLSRSKVKPTLRHMHIILRSILRREKQIVYGSGWNALAARFSSSRRDEASPHLDRISDVVDTLDPTAGIRLTARHRYGALARPLIDNLSERRVRSDPAMFAMRLKHDGIMRSDLDSAREVFHAYIARGLRPTAYHFASLMEGHTLTGDILGAEDVMQAAIDAGVEPTVVMYTTLIVGHARKGKPHLALRTFQRMLDAGVKPDVPAIDAVASAFFAAGAYRMAARVIISLWPHVGRFPPELADASLRDLAREFRKLHAPNVHRTGPMTKAQSRMLRRKTGRLLSLWAKVSNSSGLTCPTS
ncbi:hypothetical protein AB1N83_001295 [Pleurotus pulmonarius]